MGRTSGKLIPFLWDNLENESFVNLNWINPESRSFRLLLPRFEKKQDLRPYEDILIKWYFVNEREYHGYSKAKAVLKAALKKSVYIVYLQRNSQELWFRFASKDEIKEKRKKQKQSNLNPHDPLLNASYMLSPSPSAVDSPNPPPSNSSGYISENEDLDENLSDDLDENLFDDSSAFADLNFDILMHPEKLIDYDVLNNFIGNNDSSGDAINDHSEAVHPNLELNWENITLANGNLEDNRKTIPPENIKLNGTETMHQSYEINDDLEQPVVEELMATVINSSQVSNTYWLCKKKLNIDSILLLICEKEVIRDENKGFVPGHFYLNNALKPGVKYNIEKDFEFDGKYFLFLLPDN